jgi:alanine racemase
MATEHRLAAFLSSRALKNNYEAIREQVPGLGILPMIKANGYGHDSAWVARELLHFPDLYALGVATFEEALEVRKALGARHLRSKIVVFSDSAPWDEDKGRFCERHGLTPAITSDEDWFKFLKHGWPERISYELMFNTGMNRMGLTLGIAPQVARELKKRPAIAHPDGVFSHLAMSETPDSKLSRQQLERFIALRSELEAALPSTLFHLANSGGIWNHKHFELLKHTDAVRPGLSLYGIPPWPGAPVRGLTPVMSVIAKVVHVHRQLKAGETVGYGATFKVKDPCSVAIIGAGYADGLFRSLGAEGTVWLQGKAGGGRYERFAGRISMDLAAITCPGTTQVGDGVEILGPRIDPWKQAGLAGTIPYELLTSVGSRVQRVYEL